MHKQHRTALAVHYCFVQEISVVDAVFRKQKFSCLSKVDLSKKGSIDVAVNDVVVFINDCDQYFTTSSCSGRIYIYEEVCNFFVCKSRQVN